MHYGLVKDYQIGIGLADWHYIGPGLVDWQSGQILSLAWHLVRPSLRLVGSL